MSRRSPKFLGLLRRFAGATGGNVAIIFTIVLVPLVTFVGAAIDYSRANMARTSMQAALDSAALMVSKDLSAGTITTAQVSAKAQAYFTALYTSKEASGVTRLRDLYRRHRHHRLDGADQRLRLDRH